MSKKHKLSPDEDHEIIARAARRAGEESLRKTKELIAREASATPRGESWIEVGLHCPDCGKIVEGRSPDGIGFLIEDKAKLHPSWSRDRISGAMRTAYHAMRQHWSAP